MRSRRVPFLACSQATLELAFVSINFTKNAGHCCGASRRLYKFTYALRILNNVFSLVNAIIVAQLYTYGYAEVPFVVDKILINGGVIYRTRAARINAVTLCGAAMLSDVLIDKACSILIAFQQLGFDSSHLIELILCRNGARMAAYLSTKRMERIQFSRKCENMKAEA